MPRVTTKMGSWTDRDESFWRELGKGNTRKVRRFVSEKPESVSWTRSTDGSTALIVAAANGFEAIAELLSVAGAPLDARNAAGHTAVEVASSAGFAGVVELLLAHGASASQSALRAATDAGFADIARMLSAHL